ncbi:unnamed protein product [Sphagnum jensenii]|uniref:Uncharacterized protein n=1 Tax=Sphagnum jensenii TaxID=128206 RepID=A0ABP0VYU5_9BRYO
MAKASDAEEFETNEETPSPPPQQQQQPDENESIKVTQPAGIWKPPIVYGPKNVLRFPLRGGGVHRWVREVKKNLCPEDTWVHHPLETVDDPLAFSTLPPQTTPILQRKGPPFHYRLHKAIASGDRKVSTYPSTIIVDPGGRTSRKKGGGWSCRKWVERPIPRNLINHTEEEWEEFLEKQAAEDAKDEVQLQEMLSKMLGRGPGSGEGIDQESLHKETDEILLKNKNHHQDRKAAMFKLWERQVFHNINDQIMNKLKNISPDQIESKLRYQQNRYVKEVNKRHVFLDLINKEYDPFELKLAGHVHYHSNNNKVCDPLKHDFHKDMRERAVLAMNPVFQKLHNNSKEILDPQFWPYDKFRSTVHGHINADDEDATYKPREMIEMKWYSKPVFWNGTWGDECYNEAFLPGGKGMPPKPADGKEFVWSCSKNMVWDSPIRSLRQFVISEEANPLL